MKQTFGRCVLFILDFLELLFTSNRRYFKIKGYEESFNAEGKLIGYYKKKSWNGKTTNSFKKD